MQIEYIEKADGDYNIMMTNGTLLITPDDELDFFITYGKGNGTTITKAQYQRLLKMKKFLNSLGIKNSIDEILQVK